METIILVSVLTTLGVVAVLLSVVVAFIKLKNKVDVTQMENEIRLIHETIDSNKNDIQKTIDSIYHQMEQNNNQINSLLDNVRANLYGHIDSRCDKLDSKIKEKNK